MEIILPENIRDYIGTLSGDKISFAIQFAMNNPDCNLDVIKSAVEAQ